VAEHLEKLFRRHGPPLFLKRDNGSPLNAAEVDAVLADYGVIPLNSPAYYPRYNGAMEKSIRDFKAALAKRQPKAANVPRRLPSPSNSPPTISTISHGAASKAVPPAPSSMTTPNGCAGPNASAKPFSGCCF